MISRQNYLKNRSYDSNSLQFERKNAPFTLWPFPWKPQCGSTSNAHRQLDIGLLDDFQVTVINVCHSPVKCRHVCKLLRSFIHFFHDFRHNFRDVLTALTLNICFGICLLLKGHGGAIGAKSNIFLKSGCVCNL